MCRNKYPLTTAVTIFQYTRAIAFSTGACQILSMNLRCLATFCGVLLALLIAGCSTTPPVDWDKRVGTYTFDQAVTDYGPPDKSAKLSDGSTVAEWMTSRGGTIISGPPFYPYGPYYTAPIAPIYSETRLPSYYLRLIFDANGRLTASKKFAK